MYAFQMTRHGSDTNGNSRWACTLLVERSHESTTRRGTPCTRREMVGRIRVIGGKDMRDEMRSALPDRLWMELPEIVGIPSRKAQRTANAAGEQVLPWHRVMDLLDNPPHALIAHASNRADAIAKAGA